MKRRAAVRALFALTLAFPSIALADDFVVLRHRTNPVSTLDATDLHRLFTGRTKQWEGGQVVQAIVMISETAPEMLFLAGLFGMSTRDLLSRIQQEVFRGEMRRPLVVQSSRECVEAVRANPGGLCVAEVSVLAGLPADVVAVRVTR